MKWCELILNHMIVAPHRHNPYLPRSNAGGKGRRGEGGVADLLGTKTRRLIPLEGNERRREGRACILDQRGEMQNMLRLRPMVPTQGLQQHGLCVRALLCHVTGGVFIAIPKVWQIRARSGRPTGGAA